MGSVLPRDGNRVALLGVDADPTCSVPTNWADRVSVVRDVETGAQSTIVGKMMDFAISPGGHELVATTCREDNYECRIPLQRASIPETLGAPVTLQPVNDQTLSFLRIVSRPDGLYAIVDPHVQNCGCGERGDRFDRDITIRRYSWTDLGGAGAQLFTVQGPLYFDHVIPTAAGLYAEGVANSQATPALYRLDAGGAHVLRALPSDGYFEIVSVS